MMTWNCQRCYRVVKFHHVYCLCGQQRPNGWMAEYQSDVKGAKGKGKSKGKNTYPSARRYPSRPRSRAPSLPREDHHTNKLAAMNKSIVQKVVSKIPMASPSEAESHPKWIAPPVTDDPMEVGKFRRD
eukprot:9477280-Pyramimonas_sp.AAC.1